MKPEDRWKKLVKACNDFLYIHMYPNGLEFQSYQHRDLVRTFFAGCFEMLIAINDKQTGNGLIDFYDKMSEPNWFPGDEFRDYRHTPERN